jgi:hypothetical protein
MSDRDNAAAKTESATADTTEGKYVYCIIRNDRSCEFGEIGIGGGARVYSLHRDPAPFASSVLVGLKSSTGCG